MALGKCIGRFSRITPSFFTYVLTEFSKISVTSQEIFPSSIKMTDPIPTDSGNALYVQAIRRSSPSIAVSVVISSVYPASSLTGLPSLRIPDLISGPVVIIAVAISMSGLC